MSQAEPISYFKLVDVQTLIQNLRAEVNESGF